MSLGAENLWSLLKQQEKQLDIMSLAKFSNEFAIIGARYAKDPWDAQSSSEAYQQSPPGRARKQLFVMLANPNDTVIWQRSYPAFSNVNEIFSTATTSDHRLCIVYGEKRNHDDILNPVLVQISKKGKILWAKRDVIASLALNKSRIEINEQLANLDTIRVVASPDNGCLLTFVTRQYIGQAEKFHLYIMKYKENGHLKWRNDLETSTFGKQFLINDVGAQHYVVIQTNQSRDAAIEAMVMGIPFVPQTSIIGISYSGTTAYQHHNPESLRNVWVKDAVDTSGKGILLVGKTRSAWAGRIDSNANLLEVVDGAEGEYQAVTVTSEQNYLIARDDHLALFNHELSSHQDAAIKDLLVGGYYNHYLLARLPDDLPVDQIIYLGRGEYLLLYKLGEKLIKVRLGGSSEAHVGG